MKLPITIWSDIACPWCWVGKRRLEHAIEQLLEQGEGLEFDVIFRSFELDPRKKAVGDDTSYVQRLAAKYRLPTARAQNLLDNMMRTGVEEGIAFDFERAVPANTFDAHRLLHWARTLNESSKMERTQVRLKEAFMAAHFEQGVDLGSQTGLLGVVETLGLDVASAASVLRSDTHASDVRKDEEEAQVLGITGVPFFVIGHFGVSGAQRPETLIEVIERALTEQADAEREAGDAAAAQNAAQAGACTPETC